MGKLKKPEGLAPEAERIWDEYFTEMQVIQTMFIKIAMMSDTQAFEYLNMWCTICSNHAGQYLEAMEGTTVQ